MVSDEPWKKLIKNNKETTMKTLTIKQEMIEELDSDESKLEFANSVISMFEDPEPTTNSLTAKALYEGLNVDLPALQISAPFDSKNMWAPEYRRYRMTQAGYVPVCLDSSYDDYEYRYLDDMSDSEVRSFMAEVGRKRCHCKGRRGHLKFLQHVRLACATYCIEADRECCLDNFNVL